MMIKRNVHCVRGQQELQRWNSQIKTLYQWNLILKGLIRPLLAGRHQMETGKEQLRTNCSILLFKWVVNHPDMWPFSSLPSSFSLIRPFIPSDSPSIPPRLLIFRLHFKNALSLQSSASAEGPGWSRGPSAASVPSPAAWRGRVSHGAQVQERPGAEAEDPAAGAFSAATPGRPLPHRGLPGGDIWGKITNYNNKRIED